MPARVTSPTLHTRGYKPKSGERGRTKKQARRLTKRERQLAFNRLLKRNSRTYQEPLKKFTIAIHTSYQKPGAITTPDPLYARQLLTDQIKIDQTRLDKIIKKLDNWREILQAEKDKGLSPFKRGESLTKLSDERRELRIRLQKNNAQLKLLAEKITGRAKKEKAEK